MRKKFVFPLEQRKIGCCLVCPCCNEVIAGGAAHVTRAEQEVHDPCARRFDLVMATKSEVESILGAVPAKVIEDTGILERLERACTVGAIRKIVLDFCQALRRARKWLKEQFEELAPPIAEQLVSIGQKFQVGPQEIMKYLAV